MEDIVTAYKHEYTTRFIIDESKCFSRLKEMNLKNYERTFIIIDNKVAPLYQDCILENLNCNRSEIYIYEVEAIEYSKSINFYPQLIRFLESHTVGRYDAVVAIGGGIIIDLVSCEGYLYLLLRLL